MNPVATDPTRSSSEAKATAAWHHFLVVGSAFLVIETVVLFLVGGPFFGESDSVLLFLVIAGAGGFGYLMLGIWAGSWLSVLFIILPIVIAVPIGGTWADGSSASETPLYVSWTFFTIYFFAPAWLLGLLTSFAMRSYSQTPE